MKPKAKAIIRAIGVTGLALLILFFAVLKSSDYKPELKPAVTQQQLQQKLNNQSDQKALAQTPKSPAAPTTPTVNQPSQPTPASNPTPTPVATPTPAPTPNPTEPLPNSGPGTLFFVFIGITLVGYFACQPVLGRRTIIFFENENRG